MAWGIFGKIFSKRSNSQPALSSKQSSSKPVQSKKNVNSSQMLNSLQSSAPNLASQISASRSSMSQTNNYFKKSYGEMAPDSIDTEDEMNTNLSPRTKSVSINVPAKFKTRAEEQLNNKVHETVQSNLSNKDSKIISSTGFEESSETTSNSNSKQSTGKDLEFLNSISNLNIRRPSNAESVTTITANMSEISQSQPINASPRIKEIHEQQQSKTKQPLPVATSTTKKQIGSFTPQEEFGPIGTGFTINKINTSQSVTFKEPESESILIEPILKKTSNQYENKQTNNDQMNLIELSKENKYLQKRVEELENELLERDNYNKREIDLLMAKFHDALRDKQEKEEFKRLSLSKQQETNEKVMNEQSRLIETLKFKCKRLETELGNSNLDSLQIKEIKHENDELKNLVHRLNSELSSYQAKYPFSNLKQNEFKGLPSEGPTPLWLLNLKYLSPLLVEYDEQINEKDEKIKLMKQKIDDLTNKFKLIIEENSDLHSKYDQIPLNISNKMDEITGQAKLVLEENINFKEQLELKSTRLIEVERNHIQEIGRLSKKIIISETERVNLQNQLDLYKENHDSMLKKYNDISVETQRRITLEDHLNQIGDLKRKIEEINIIHKQELENTLAQLQSSQTEKKDLTNKYTNLLAENKKLTAEIKVLDKRIEEQFGRNMQKKLQDLEKRAELAEINEKVAFEILEKLTKEAEKIRVEKQTFLNLAKTNEIEAKKNENKLMEENLKVSKLEDKLQVFKERASSKLAKTFLKLQQKDSEFLAVKLENDKKISNILNLLQKKQDQINEFLKEKRHLETELENAWENTSNENEKLKSILLDFKKS